MYTLETPLGNLEYKPVNMLDVDLSVARWKAENKPPTMPKIRESWTAIETGRLITTSMRRYGKEPAYITSEQKKELKREIEDTLPMVDNPYDKQYKQDKLDYANSVYLNHWQAVINDGVIAGDSNERTLALLMSFDIVRDNKTEDDIKENDKYKRSTYQFKIHNAIMKVSCITAELVHNCLLALDRYYKGVPFVDVLEVRAEKRDSDIPSEAFRHSINDLFIRNSLYEHANTLPIDEQSMLAAMLLSRANMDVWYSEDARQEAVNRGTGIIKPMVSR